MKELEELGIDTSNASICWLETVLDGDIVVPNDKQLLQVITKNINLKCDMQILTFSLNDILSMLPKIIIEDNLNMYNLHIKPISFNNIWRVEYSSHLHSEQGTLLEASFKMLKWALKNKNKYTLWRN